MSNQYFDKYPTVEEFLDKMVGTNFGDIEMVRMLYDLKSQLNTLQDKIHFLENVEPYEKEDEVELIKALTEEGWY